jgi:hypothetical protein
MNDGVERRPAVAHRLIEGHDELLIEALFTDQPNREICKVQRGSYATEPNEWSLQLHGPP